ncbi:hypothetical protein FT663_05382 [Candidozyma haemuli var. vulneris]|nr:hypothetical protein FT663_05382 [[Candida] haemuloni var. vulneris]KAF3992781.1 hypothetical protein FT662_00990 [[Candida] haemuloni var. vulneris]
MKKPYFSQTLHIGNSDIPDVKLDEFTVYSGSSSELANLDQFLPTPSTAGFNDTSQESSSSENDTPSQLRWIDESKEYFPEIKQAPKMPKNVSSDDIDKVRKRLSKRKHRPLEVKAEAVPMSDKRTRNTLAARRYRERQRKDVEVLDSRIKQIEEELNNAKLEIMWWKMESKRWKEEAEKGSKSS